MALVLFQVIFPLSLLQIIVFIPELYLDSVFETWSASVVWFYLLKMFWFFFHFYSSSLCLTASLVPSFLKLTPIIKICSLEFVMEFLTAARGSERYWQQNFWHIKNPSDCPKARSVIIQSVSEAQWMNPLKQLSSNLAEVFPDSIIVQRPIL